MRGAITLTREQTLLLIRAAVFGLKSSQNVITEYDEKVAEQLFDILRVMASEVVDEKLDPPQYVLCLSGHWHNTTAESAQCNMDRAASRLNENSKPSKI